MSDAMDNEILSELFKGSKEAQLDDFASGNGETIDVIDVLYGQAVEVAKEMDWPVPSRTEFEEQYKQEIEKLRRHEA